MRGKPNCADCGGRGGNRVDGKWYPCKCTRMDKRTRDAMRTFNSSGARFPHRIGRLFDDGLPED